MRPRERVYADMPYDLSRHLVQFMDFANAFIGENGVDNTNINIKLDHSLRVLEEAKHITQSLGMDPILAQLSKLAALFHDIGRFLQYRRFRTFNDRISANHAKLSIDVLREKGFLSDCTPEHRRLVMGAIFLHNRLTLPSRLPAGLNVVARVVRDADKLDIMNLLLDHFAADASPNGIVTLGLAAHPDAYTSSMLDAVKSRKTALYEEMVWVNDFKLLVCSWVYDFNFSVTRRAVLERRYLVRLFDGLPKDAEFAALKAQLINDLSRGAENHLL